jgi:hypothetical protein
VALAGVAAAVLCGWLSIRLARPPEALGTDTSPTEFAAVRAMAAVEPITRQPRPLGSREHALTRSYLTEELSRLGFEVEVQGATVLSGFGDSSVLAARVNNVLARLPGRDAGPAVLLATHYDTRSNTPGAGDAGSGVATLLETARALTAGPPLARDVALLISDGEELDLFGARAFVAEHPWADSIGLALNFEARGNRGPVIMFETGPGNHPLVEHFARAAPHPFANSLSYEVYRRMPNDSDFSVFKRYGIPGLNFAMIGFHAAYHTQLDSPERLDLGSVQHQGSYALALARHFGNLVELPPRGADGVYLNGLGWQFFSYSAGSARVLAVLLVFLAMAGTWIRSRRTQGRVLGIGAGAVLLLAAGVVALVVGWVTWWFLEVSASGLLRTPHGLPYATGLFGFAEAYLVVSVVCILLLSRGGVSRPVDLFCGVLLGWTVLALLIAFFLPGASYIFFWPALCGWLSLIAAEAVWRGRKEVGAPEVALFAVAGLPAVVLLTPLIALFVEALTLQQAGPALLLLAFLLTLYTVPLAVLLAHRRGWILIGASALIAIGLFVVGVVSFRPGAETPASNYLLYALDSDLERGFWISSDPEPDEWTASFVGQEATPEEAPRQLAFLRWDVLQAEAPALELAKPRVTVERATADGRTLGLRLTSERAAPVMRLRVEAEESFAVLSIDGKPVTKEILPEAGALSEFDLVFYAVPPEGIDLELETGGGPLDIHLADQTYGLPTLPDGSKPSRPVGWIPSSSWLSDSTFVSRSLLIEGPGSEVVAPDV